MRWLQFLRPVKSIQADGARELLVRDPDLQVVDVRQPGEYAQGHIPGARLMPVAHLGDKMDELDRNKPVLAYCAVGGRSRVAAQMLAGKGFDQVLNLAGGFKAWNGWTGFGEYDQGLELFTDTTSLEQTLTIAYGMEAALEEFYRSMAGRVGNQEAAGLFSRLAEIEVKHKEAVAGRMRQAMGGEPAPDHGAGSRGTPEGGRTTEEYMRRLGLDLEQPADIVDFAMAVEAQALDLYSRAALQARDEVRAFLESMAREEKEHLVRLGGLMDQLQEAG